jgi:hypothetical protein
MVDTAKNTTPLEGLEALATKLADAKRKADAAAEAYKKAEAAWKAQEATAALIAEKKATDSTKKAHESRARELMLSYATETGNADLPLKYYTLTTSNKPSIPDAPTLVAWLIREAPVIARQVLTVDLKALEKLLRDNSKDGKIAPALAEMPVSLEAETGTRINWKSLEALEATSPAEQSGNA